MATPMQPTDQDHELLSAYLDGELPASARTALEARLATEPALRAALDDLRATVQILRAAPAIKPPRSFTLDPARYQRRTPWWARAGVLQLTGAFGTLVSVLLIAFGVLLSAGGVSAPLASVRNVAVLATATSPTVGIAGGRTEEHQATSGALDESIGSSTETSTEQPRVATETRRLAGTAALADSLTAEVQATAARAVATATPLPTMTARRASIPPTPTALPTMPPTALPTMHPTAAALAMPTYPAAAVMPAPPGVSPDKGVSGPVQPTEASLAAQSGAPVEPPQAGGTGGSSAQSVQGSATATGVTAGYAATPVPPTATPLRTATAAETTSPLPASATAEGFTEKSAVAEAPTVMATAMAATTIVKPKSPTGTATASPMPTGPTARGDLGGSGQTNSAATFALIVGIALFVFSVVLLGIGFLRSRL
jgi:hypothetical protein